MIKIIKKISLVCVPLGILFGLFFIDSTVLAQSLSPPTLLPAEDVSVQEGLSECAGLASAIASGDIHLGHMPCFLKIFTQTLIGIAGSLAVLFVMIGGYRYVIGRDEDKDAAKKTITYALIGLAVTLLAWIIVDLVLQIATE